MSLKEVTTQQLRLRKMILERIIRENMSDPRVGEPRRQLAIIDEELELRENIDNTKENEHEGLVVGLSTLELKGSSKLRG